MNDVIKTTMQLFVAVLLLYPQVSSGQSLSPIGHGTMSFSAGGGVSENSITLTVTGGYFISDNIMPGASYAYSFQKGDPLDYHISWQMLDVFIRVYVARQSKLYPYFVGGAGWLFYSQEGPDVMDKQWSLSSVFVGAGVLLLLDRHFGLDLGIGWRQYLSVPRTLKDTGFKEGRVMWSLGFGVFL